MNEDMFEIKTPDHPYEQNELNEFNFCKCGVAKRLHKDTPDKRVEEIVEQMLDRSNCPPSCDGYGTYAEADSDGDPSPSQCQWCYENVIPQRERFIALITQYHQDLIEDILKMAEALEVECGKDGDKGTKQWMAFKGFRNTIRDKYIIKLSK